VSQLKAIRNVSMWYLKQKYVMANEFTCDFGQVHLTVALIISQFCKILGL